MSGATIGAGGTGREIALSGCYVVLVEGVATDVRSDGLAALAQARYRQAGKTRKPAVEIHHCPATIRHWYEGGSLRSEISPDLSSSSLVVCL